MSARECYVLESYVLEILLYHLFGWPLSLPGHVKDQFLLNSENADYISEVLQGSIF
jgi:hypothetical protein